MSTFLSILPYIVYAFIIFTGIRMFLSYLQNKKNRNLLNEGKFEEAIKIYEDLHKKHTLKDKKYKGLYLINISKCYYRMGKFKKSNQTLERFDLKELDDNYKIMYYGMYASNLALMEKDLEKAHNYIVMARKLYDLPDLILNQAIIERVQNKETAGETFAEYKEKASVSKKASKGDTFGQDVVENYLVGLYYQKSNEKDKAKEYFEKASKCEYENYFSSKAKGFIK